MGASMRAAWAMHPLRLHIPPPAFHMLVHPLPCLLPLKISIRTSSLHCIMSLPGNVAAASTCMELPPRLPCP
eukprot:365738-Chlamydomonas_euryale.AAC.27